MPSDFATWMINCVSELTVFIDSFPAMAIAASSGRCVETDSESMPNVSAE
jgi:hypothetical protein